MSAGIYEIRNQINGNCYIGSTARLEKRWREHLNQLRRQQHPNRYLQAAFDKYEEGAFIFSILENAKSQMLLAREQHYLDMLKPKYNIAPVAGNSLGCRRSPETCKRISEAQSGEQNSFYGKHHSDKVKKIVSETHKGKPLSEKHRQKIRVAMSGSRHHNYGKHPSDETRRRLSDAHKAYWRRIRIGEQER